MTQIIPKLGLKFLLDSSLGEYAQDKIDKVNAATAFAAVVPSTATVDAKNTAWRAALSKADNGTKADTAYKNQVRAELEALLTQQAQNCAEIANGDLALYLSTGYEAKAQGSPTGKLPQVTGLHLSFTNNTGELKAGWYPIEDAENFTVQVFTDINNPEDTMVKQYIRGKIGKSMTTLEGLPSFQDVYVRVRANGGSTGFGDWSDVVQKRVP